ARLIRPTGSAFLLQAGQGVYAVSGSGCLMRRLRVLSGLRVLHSFCRPDKAFTPHPALVA
ncbi:hypothetical protein, partial [Escherichia albertii]|uniref:hypothetical protein n=1 Tax=Escherichia albertii TaxID=208962 RepID=UPI001BB22C2D